MVAGRLLLDTNVLIYALQANRESAIRLLASAPKSAFAVSRVSWMEVLVGATVMNETLLRDYLDTFELIGFDQAILERTILVRRQLRLKLPDAAIYASALTTGRTLVTYNTRDFPPGTPSVLNPDAPTEAMR